MFCGNILFYIMQFEYRILSTYFHYIREQCKWNMLLIIDIQECNLYCSLFSSCNIIGSWYYNMLTTPKILNICAKQATLSS